MTRLSLITMAAGIIIINACKPAFAQQSAPQLGKAPNKAIIQQMTLEEKASLVVGSGLRLDGNGPINGEADNKVPGATGNTMSISRFGIPGTVLSDGPAGVRILPYHKGDSSKSFFATAWPVGTLLASSWDTSLVKRVGIAFGKEAKEYGVDVMLAPGMNIQRNPLNGRNFEYFSEDPIVSGYMAASMVKGIQSNGVGASIKHFAANNVETNRALINSVVSERALREIYLRNFEIAVKTSQPYTIMSSYNKINGTYTSESADLLTKILREDWGYNGMVMSDWLAGRDAVAQMKAGNNLLEPGTKRQQEIIIEAVKNGSLDVTLLDQNVEKVLEYIQKTPAFKKFQYSNAPNLKANAALSRSAAAEGMVLLKNSKGALPLLKTNSVALYGVGSYRTIIGGTGSGEVNTAYTISIEDGLTKAGYHLNPDLKQLYMNYVLEDVKLHPKKTITLGAPRYIPEYDISDELIKGAAEKNDVAIFTISRNAGEAADRKVEGDFGLTELERKKLTLISDAFHAKRKKFIVLLNISGPIEIESWRDKADAILLTWQPGEEAGNAVADVVSGSVNPSGKLAITFPAKYEDEPSAKNFPGSPAGNPANTNYEEGIYVGYRYFDTFRIKPAYSFGFGASYTRFAYNGLTLSASKFKNQLIVNATITNTGKKAGKEIVQLYIKAPAKLMDKPNKELKGFCKTKLLLPGESQKLRFTIHAKDLASFDTAQSAWVAEGGEYKVLIGASSEDIKLQRQFSLNSTMIVEKDHKALVPQAAVSDLRPQK